MNNLHEVHPVIRGRLLEVPMLVERICFSLYQPYDAGPNLAGDLFEQDADFIMAEIDLPEVVRRGPGQHALRRAFGALDLTYYTKDVLDPYSAMVKLEEIADLFREETIGGVRFRNFTPTGEMRDRGFSAHTGTIAFDFDTSAKHD